MGYGHWAHEDRRAVKQRNRLFGERVKSPVLGAQNLMGQGSAASCNWTCVAVNWNITVNALSGEKLVP